MEVLTLSFQKFVLNRMKSDLDVLLKTNFVVSDT